MGVWSSEAVNHSDADTSVYCIIIYIKLLYIAPMMTQQYGCEVKRILCIIIMIAIAGVLVFIFLKN